MPATPRPRAFGVYARLLVTLLPASLLVASCVTQEDTTANNPAPPPAANNTASNGPSAGSGNAAAAAFETPRKADGPLKIRIITNGISPFWDPMAIGMQRAAAELGCDASWSGPQNATVPEQKQIMEQMIAQGADGIAISSVEAAPTVQLIQMALDKGIPVITFDSDSPASKRLCYIGTNNIKAGEAAGGAAVQLLPNGGTFVGFVGNQSAQNARERRDGFVNATRDHKIVLDQVLDDQKSASQARRNVEDTIAKSGDKIQGLLGLFSYNGPQIAGAVTAKPGLREKYKVVCFDAEPKTLQELEKGNIDATVVQRPYEFGYRSTKLLYLINRKGWTEAAKEMNVPADGIVDTGVEVVTPATVKQYKAGLEKLGIKSS